MLHGRNNENVLRRKKNLSIVPVIQHGCRARTLWRFAGRQRPPGQRLEETVQLCSLDQEGHGSCLVAHPRKNSQTCL